MCAQVARVLGETLLPEAAAPLAEAVKDPDRLVRSQAVIALGRIGRYAPAIAVPALMEATKDTDSQVQSQARQTLAQVDPRAARRVQGQ